jgi:tetratricopeptide (TPR) repeat protein
MQFRASRLAGSVRRAFAARRYDMARGLLDRWIMNQPRSGEAQYYRAWLALADDRPPDVVEAVERAKELGYDRARLEVLKAIYLARGGRIDVESILRQAFDQESEPRAEIARELAAIYLKSSRLQEAARAVERYRALVPSDAQAYLWINGIASRTGATPAILIRNYRAALECDPQLDKARLGLAEQLSKDRRMDEAEREYCTYLCRNPEDAAALVSLGRNALHAGRIDAAARAFEGALARDRRQVDALKEMAQIDLRLGRSRPARSRLELLKQIRPFEPVVGQLLAQALELDGEPEEARTEAERARQLLKDQKRIVQLQTRILNDPNDVASRLELARWMLESGQVEEGLKRTREVLRTDPDHGPTHRLLADYYARRGDHGLANYHRVRSSSAQEAK